MTDRDMTNRTSTTRRDLRFAGTIAAGLCAGVLGVGAIAVPLVGWNDWPQALTAADDGSIIFTDADADARGDAGDRRARYSPRTTVSGPSGAVALVTSPGLAAAATGTTGESGTSGQAGTDGSAAPAAGGPSGSAESRRSRAALRSVGRGAK